MGLKPSQKTTASLKLTFFRQMTSVRYVRYDHIRTIVNRLSVEIGGYDTYEPWNRLRSVLAIWGDDTIISIFFFRPWFRMCSLTWPPSLDTSCPTPPSSSESPTSRYKKIYLIKITTLQLTCQEMSAGFRAAIPHGVAGCFYVKPNFPGRCSHVCNGGFIVRSVSKQSDNFFCPDSVLRQQHNDHPQQPEDQLLLPRKKEFLAPFWDK